MSVETRAAIWEANKRYTHWEIDDEYKSALQRLWDKAIEWIAPPEKNEGTTQHQEQIKKRLDEPYRRTHPATMLTEEKAILDDPDHRWSRSRLMKQMEELKQDSENEATRAIRETLNLESPTDRDILFLLRLQRFTEAANLNIDFILGGAIDP